MTDLATRLRRLHYRSHHRGTREADYVVGGFFDRHHGDWAEADLLWFEALIDEQDADILAWAMNAAEAPPHWQGPMLTAMQQLDYIDIIP
jgi:antitoxin CptB